MPSSSTITSFYSFAPATVITSSEVNNNFSVFRGHLLPVDPTAASSPDNTYDLGSSDHRWRFIYGKTIPHVLSTSGSITLANNSHSTILMNTTAATLTATLPAIANSTGTSFTLKNTGTGGKTLFVDGNGSETIDNTITVNLVDYESATFLSDGVQWQML